MKALKKYIPLVIAFVLGALITYLAMSLKIAKQEFDREFNQGLIEAKSTDATVEVVEPQRPQKEKEQQHWLKELEEKQAAESQERTKQQQSQGDKLKSQFDQFAE